LISLPYWYNCFVFYFLFTVSWLPFSRNSFKICFLMKWKYWLKKSAAMKKKKSVFPLAYWERKTFHWKRNANRWNLQNQFTIKNPKKIPKNGRCRGFGGVCVCVAYMVRWWLSMALVATILWYKLIQWIINHILEPWTTSAGASKTRPHLIIWRALIPNWIEIRRIYFHSKRKSTKYPNEIAPGAWAPGISNKMRKKKIYKNKLCALKKKKKNKLFLN